jgi:hypothetical protein
MCFGLLTGLGMVSLANSWPIIKAQFSTAQPFALQAVIVIAGGVLATVALATAIALAVGLVHRWIPSQPGDIGIFDVLAGTGLGLTISGIAAAAAGVVPALDPTWPNIESAATFSPLLATTLDPISGWIGGTVFVLLIYSIVDAVSRGWSQNRLFMTGALILTGFVVAGADGVSTLARWVAEGSLTGVVVWAAFLLVFRHHVALVPMTAATISATAVVREGIMHAYPGALAGSVVAAVLIMALGYIWMTLMTRDSAASGE